ncbi:hypothetical protein F4561_000515 [Lipingzhangella halophila]|uniref:Uncharacterized protein n=1 Tax=Lipingzhangella halophila TaxID=1783352 RepID=A0A7W7RCX1_9ACTN|nr:hypothetical protein [Lipingzhangella halophila]MBB4929695.1 hypothetical protein [Lipingzhangella halophila]
MLKKICAIVAISAAMVLGSSVPAATAAEAEATTTSSAGWSWAR